VAGAFLRAQETATGARFTATSGADGGYHLLGLPAGQYTLVVEANGFRTYQQFGIALRMADHAALDVRLEVGGAEAQAVTVTAEVPLLQTSGGSVSYSVDQTKLLSMPLDGRNFVPLVALSPGVALPNGSVLPRINGSRPRTNEYLYDGMSVLQPEPGQVAFYPVIDAIEEFRLNINSYSPEYGRSNGGTVMVNTKSGSNELHGSLFEFFRNEKLNARNYFAPAGAKPEFRRNQYGFTLGGPIQKNRTFYFVDWQGTRLRTGITRFSTVPTAAQRQGIFTNPVYDPATSPRTPFPGNAIPAARFDPIAIAVLSHYPQPNLPGTANNYVRTAAEPDAQDQFDGRLDHHFSERHRGFLRYSRLRDEDDPVTPLPDGSGLLASGVIGHAITQGEGLASEYDWSRSAGMLNQIRLGYTRRRLHQTSLQHGDITIPGVPATAFASVLPTFTLSGYQQIGPTTAANSNFATSVTEYLDTLTIVRGHHTLKFGTDIRREALDVLNPPNPAGSYDFTATGSNAAGVANSGNPVASLLLGQVRAFSIDLQDQPLLERAHIAEFFANDDWKISSRLSLSLGTRYTLNFPSTEVHNHGAVFNLRTQLLEFPHTARELECCDFGPRVGLAYRATSNSTIRAGYGMIWFEQTGITTPFTLPQFPFIQTVGQQSSDDLNSAFQLSRGPTVQVTAPNPNSGLGQGVFAVDRNQGSGYSQQWNVTVQRTVGSNWNLEAGYLGSKNTRLGVPDVNLNQLPAADLPLGAALLQRVPNPYYGQIPASSSLGGPTITAQQLLRAFPRFTTVALFRNNVGNSTYHALQTKLERRLSAGLTMTLAYTWSKLLDDASSVFSNTIFTGPVANYPVADSFNRRLEKDVSNGDIPHVFSAGWVYQAPRFWKLSGWQIAGMVRVQSGDAVAVAQATNLNASLGFGTQRPNRVGNPNDLRNRSTARWFNTAAFVPAPQFTIGNTSRNPVRGPGLQNADLMLGKSFPLQEQLQLEFRLEVFNVSNTPPLNDPNGSFGAAAFGTITSAGNPRDFELCLKLRW
jgi:hypothetical protein